MAVEIGNGSRILVTVRGAGLKGPPGDDGADGETPTVYLKSISREDGQPHVVTRGDDSEYRIAHVSVAEVEDGVFEIEVVNEDGSAVRVAVAGGTMLLVNPTIYLRQDTGSAAPPISEQADLTAANAFNNFENISAFLSKCLVAGNVTIDARGTFETTTFTPGLFASAPLITLTGNPSDPDDLTFEWARSASGPAGQDGVRAQLGVRLRLGNCRFHAKEAAPSCGAIIADNPGSTIYLFGVIRYSNDGGSAPGANAFLHIAGTGSLITSEQSAVNAQPSVVHDIDLTGSPAMSAIFSASRNGSIQHFDARFEVANDITVGAVVSAYRDGVVEFLEGTAGNFETTIQGPGDFIGPAFSVRNGGLLAFTRIDAVAWGHSSIQAYLRSTVGTYVLDKSSAVARNDEFRYGTASTDYP